MSNRPQNPNQKPEHDSGFDDPTLPNYFRNADHRNVAMQQLRQEQDEDGPAINPWPLTLLIVGLGTLLTVGYIIAHALLK